jgi:hypothetical protein
MAKRDVRLFNDCSRKAIVLRDYPRNTEYFLSSSIVGVDETSSSRESGIFSHFRYDFGEQRIVAISLAGLVEEAFRFLNELIQFGSVLGGCEYRRILPSIGARRGCNPLRRSRLCQYFGLGSTIFDDLSKCSLRKVVADRSYFYDAIPRKVFPFRVQD